MFAKTQFAKSIVFLCVCISGAALYAFAQNAPSDSNRWAFASGGTELEAYYDYKRENIPASDQKVESQTSAMLKRGLYYEAFLWANEERLPGPVGADRQLERVTKAISSQLEGWERVFNCPPSKGASWKERLRALGESAGISARAVAAERVRKDVPVKDVLALIEALLVEAADRVDEVRVAALLKLQYNLNPSEEHFRRWRAYLLHTHREQELLDFYDHPGAKSLDYPEALEDPIILRLGKRQFADAFAPLDALRKTHPDRIKRLVAGYRLAYRARLAQLCEQGRYPEAMAHIELSRKIPYNVLDYDMAVYAIYNHLLKAQEENPDGGRQALLKFLLNHAIYAEASLVGEALSREDLPAALPSTYRAIIEAKLGNSGLAFQLLREATRTEPPSAAFFFALGTVAEVYKNLWNLADACYRQSLALDRQYEPSLLALARHDLLRGRFEDARARTGQILATHPENQLALYESARIYYAQGDYDTARELFLKLASSDRAKPDHFYYLASIAMKRDDPAEARRLLEQLLDEFPEDMMAHFLLADVAHLEKNRAREVAELDELRRLADPWRFDRIQAARLHEASARRLAALGVEHPASPQFRLSSAMNTSSAAVQPETLQAGGPWRPPTKIDAANVTRPKIPQWVSLDMSWRGNLDPVVWRELSFKSRDSTCMNTLEIVNPSDYEMLGVRIFADGREFAFIYRIPPRGQTALRFRTDVFPGHIGFVYTTDLGAEMTVSPAGVLSRRVDRTLKP